MILIEGDINLYIKAYSIHAKRRLC